MSSPGATSTAPKAPASNSAPGAMVSGGAVVTTAEASVAACVVVTGVSSPPQAAAARANAIRTAVTLLYPERIFTSLPSRSSGWGRGRAPRRIVPVSFSKVCGAARRPRRGDRIPY